MTEENKNQNEEVELSVGGFDSLENYESDIINITTITLDRLFKQPKPCELVALYMFYVYTAKWQKTWKIKATTNYTSKGVHLSEKSVIRIKKRLIDLGYLKDIQTRKGGKITGHYIQLNYPCNVKLTPSFEEGVANIQTNAYNTSNINAYKIINNITPTPKGGDTQDIISFPNLPLSLGTTPATRLYTLYWHLFTKKYGQVTRVHEFRNKSILKKLATEIGEFKVAIAIIIFMNWKGAGGDDKFVENLLANSCHDLVYLPKNLVPILAYVQNKLGVKENDIESTVITKLKEYKLCQNE